MFRRIRYKKWLVAGLGTAALVAPASAVAGNHNMSSQASKALVAKSQAMNQRYAVFAQGEALNERYGVGKPLSYSAYQAILGKALNERYSSLRYGAPDGWTPYMISLTQQSRQPTVLDGRNPDTIDFAAQAHSPVVTVERDPGFQWGDFGVGLAAAMLVVALLGITRLFTGRGQRPVTTS